MKRLGWTNCRQWILRNNELYRFVLCTARLRSRCARLHVNFAKFFRISSLLITKLKTVAAQPAVDGDERLGGWEEPPMNVCAIEIKG